MSKLAPHPFRFAVADRRLAGVAMTLLVHLLLLLCWSMARRVPLPETGARSAMQWIDLPMLKPAPTPLSTPTLPPPAPVKKPAQLPRVATPVAAPVPIPAPASSAAPAMTLAPAAPLSADTPAPAAVDTMMERARRSAGAADRAVRKENRPYIVAPLDSPQIRLSNGMARAHDMAPPKLWEAPKVEELVNQTGDGVRRTRVITGDRTYCISERATNTSIDTIERHGKLRITNCPQHEDTATQQEWRTARD